MLLKSLQTVQSGDTAILFIDMIEMMERKKKLTANQELVSVLKIFRGNGINESIKGVQGRVNFKHVLCLRAFYYCTENKLTNLSAF